MTAYTPDFVTEAIRAACSVDLCKYPACDCALMPKAAKKLIVAGMEAAAKIADRHQDIVGWQPGESRNKLVGDIARAIRAEAARIRP